jgi:hypothetical protein
VASPPPEPNTSAEPSSSYALHDITWLGCTSNNSASWANVRFRFDGSQRALRLEGRSVVPTRSSPHGFSRLAGTACRPSGRKSTYRPVQISGTGSLHTIALTQVLMLSLKFSNEEFMNLLVRCALIRRQPITDLATACKSAQTLTLFRRFDGLPCTETSHGNDLDNCRSRAAVRWRWRVLGS